MQDHYGAHKVDEGISATHSYLLANYGPLLTIRHLADLLHTTPNGIRMAIARKRQPLTKALAEAKRPLGRRVYFDARRVAAAIDRDNGTAAVPRVNPLSLGAIPGSPLERM